MNSYTGSLLFATAAISFIKAVTKKYPRRDWLVNAFGDKGTVAFDFILGAIFTALGIYFLI